MKAATDRPALSPADDAIRAFLRAAWAEAFNAEMAAARGDEPAVKAAGRAALRLRRELDAMLPAGAIR